MAAAFAGVFLSISTFAMENTIYLGVNSRAGQFPETKYQLNQYTISFKDNWLVIDGQQILNTRDKKVIELFVNNQSIYLIIDKRQKITPKL